MANHGQLCKRIKSDKKSSNQPCGRDSENIIGAFLKSFSIHLYVGRAVVSLEQVTSQTDYQCCEGVISPIILDVCSYVKAQVKNYCVNVCRELEYLARCLD